MRRARGDACCDCLSLCSIYCLLAVAGVVEIVVWAALQPLLLAIGKSDLTPCLSPEGRAAETPNRTNLKFIVPSAGFSGTTSLHNAFCKMGLNTFHAEERGAYAQDTLADDVSTEVLARSLSRCRLDAIFLEPTTDLFPRLMEVSPGARVILTWRAWPSYYKTAQNLMQVFQDLTVHGLNNLCLLPMQMIRWEDWWDIVSGGVLTDAMRAAPIFGCPGDRWWVLFWMGPQRIALLSSKNRAYDRGTFKIHFDEEAYIAHHDEIRRLTPPGDLLVFDVKRHGWKELEEFTRIPLGELSETPFPNPRVSNLITHNHILIESPWSHVGFYCISAALATAEALLLLPLLRFLRPFLCICCCQRHRERWSSKQKEA